MAHLGELYTSSISYLEPMQSVKQICLTTCNELSSLTFEL